MDSAEMVYCATREEWRDWLEGNHDKCKGIWLIYYKKGSGKPRVPYDDAVEEALCFGWIDSTVRRIDEEKYAQRFTPRKPDSGWSELNMRRMEQLIKEGRMTEAGLAKYREPGCPQVDDQRPGLRHAARLRGSAGERPEGAGVFQKAPAVADEAVLPVD